MTTEVFHLHELAFMVAARVLTAENPPASLAKFGDDLADAIAAGQANLAGSQAVQEAFRDAIGYSVRVDALGEQDGGVPRGGRATSSCSPSVLRVIDGGES